MQEQGSSAKYQNREYPPQDANTRDAMNQISNRLRNKIREPIKAISKKLTKISRAGKSSLGEKSFPKAATRIMLDYKSTESKETAWTFPGNSMVIIEF